MRNPTKPVPLRLLLIAAVLLTEGCGGSSKLESYAHEPGNFKILAAGKPGLSNQTVASAAGDLSLTSVESVDSNGIRRIVVYTDLPDPLVQTSNPKTLLDGGVRGMAGSSIWSVERQGEITLDGHPGREVRFARPGHAVGAINTRIGAWVDAFQVVFMRFKDGQLDPSDSYTTNWLGNPRGGGSHTASGKGKPVIGIHGRTNGRLVGHIGLMVAE